MANGDYVEPIVSQTGESDGSAHLVHGPGDLSLVRSLLKAPKDADDGFALVDGGKDGGSKMFFADASFNFLTRNPMAPTQQHRVDGLRPRPVGETSLQNRIQV